MNDIKIYFTSYGCMGYIGNGQYMEFASENDYYDYLEEYQ